MAIQKVVTPEIRPEELVLENVLGRGTFGLVKKAIWNHKYVAVKEIHTREEIAAFEKEVETLTRVSHPNIVKIYGAYKKKPYFLVMEYAESGSLNEVIHTHREDISYTLAHAMSWCHQTSKGVSYMHSMNLIHRDLKPANLLLVNRGLTIKICDFGTACNVRTHMTTSQGSAAWMAPEVFASSTYSEKCDIFSFGIILWEVMSRRRPFGDIDGPSFSIMWAIKEGKRPPQLKSCPEPIKQLMNNCWNPEPHLRPVMRVVEQQMNFIMHVLNPDSQPLDPIQNSDSDLESPGIFLMSGIDTIRRQEFNLTEPQLVSSSSDASSDMYQNHSRHMIPFTEPQNVSRENLLEESLFRRKKSFNHVPDRENNVQDLGHRRSGSFDEAAAAASDIPDTSNSSSGLMKSRSFDDNSSLDSSSAMAISSPESSPRSPPIRPSHLPVVAPRPFNARIDTNDNLVIGIEPHLRPLQPDPNNDKSMETHKRHTVEALSYLKKKVELQLLCNRERELLNRDPNECPNVEDEFRREKQEFEQLNIMLDNLRRQLDKIKEKKKEEEAAKDGFVLVSRLETRTAAASSACSRLASTRVNKM